MKKIFVISLIFITLSSTISVLQAQTFRVEGGYSQPRIYSSEISHRFFHGINLGVTAEFDIFPEIEFLSLHTGILYSYMFGNDAQRSRFGMPLNDSIRIRTQGHQLRIPIHVQASQTVFRVIRGTVFAGPSVNIGLAMPQRITATSGLIDPEHPYRWDLASLNGFYQLGTTDLHSDRMRRLNLQLDAGLAIEWWNLQLRGGYSLGINNLNKWRQTAPGYIDLPNGTNVYINVSGVRQRQSGWFVSLGYRF